LSNSPVIPKEKLTAYQRWELHTFEQPEGQAPIHTRGPAQAADTEAARIRNVHQLAYESGRADGLREGAAKAGVDAQRFAALADSVRRQSLELNHLLADEILGVALAVAQQMVRQSLETPNDGIIAVIQDALSRVLQPVAQATITLNPADAALVQAQLGDTLAAGGWRIIEDAGVTRGGCLLHTLASELDASVETRWRRITAALGQDTPWLK
jgi:flagellar assembly protein FliH